MLTPLRPSLPLSALLLSRRYHRIQEESAQRQDLRNDIIRRVQPTLDRLCCDIREIGAVLDFYQSLDDDDVAEMLSATPADVATDVERHVR